MTMIRQVTPEYIKPRAKGLSLKQGVLALLTLSIVLSPKFTIRTGFYTPQGADFILAGILAFWIITLPLKRRNQRWAVVLPMNLTIPKILMGMLYMAVISIGVGTIAFQQRLIINDLMILPMIVRYGAIFFIGYYWAKDRTGRRVFLWALLIAIGLSAVVGVLQHYNLVGINDWLTPLYVSKNTRVVGLELVKLGLPGGRVLGTHGDPRHYAYILVVGVGLCMAILLHFRRGLIRQIAVVILGLSLMSLAFTASRTGVLSVLIVVLVAVWMQGRGNRRISRVIGPLIVALMVLAVAFPAFESQTFEDRVLTLGTTSYNTSLNARIRDLRLPFQRALESPIIWVTGRGPSKAGLRTDSHNDFGWYFYRFGLPGLLLYLSLLVSGFKGSLRGWWDAATPWNKTICLAALLLVANWFTFAMAENIFKDAQLMALNMLLLGAAAGCSRANHP